MRLTSPQSPPPPPRCTFRLWDSAWRSWPLWLGQAHARPISITWRRYEHKILPLLPRAFCLQTPKYILLTLCLQFDTLKVGTAPPNDYASVNWHGFTVVNSSETASFAAMSGAMVLEAPAFPTSGLYISQGASSDHSFVYGLSSFAFACAAPYPPDSADQWLVPVSCGLQITTKVISEDIGIQTLGPYNYKVKYSEKADLKWKMMQVNLSDVAASYIYFNLVSGSSVTTLYLDSLAFVQQDTSCYE